MFQVPRDNNISNTNEKRLQNDQRIQSGFHSCYRYKILMESKKISTTTKCRTCKIVMRPAIEICIDCLLQRQKKYRLPKKEMKFELEHATRPKP